MKPRSPSTEYADAMRARERACNDYVRWLILRAIFGAPIKEDK